jgi:hypothetical protein
MKKIQFQNKKSNSHGKNNFKNRQNFELFHIKEQNSNLPLHTEKPLHLSTLN